MHEQVEKAKENKSRSVANSVAQNKSNVLREFGFVDNRPKAIAQRKPGSSVNGYSDYQPTQTAIRKCEPQNGSDRIIQLLTITEKQTITPNKIAFVKQQFGVNTDKVITIAPDIATLMKWTSEMEACNAAVTAAKFKVENPGLTGVSKAEQQELKQAKLHIDAKLKEILSYSPTTTTPIWAVSSSLGASTSSVKSIPAPIAPTPEKLPSVTTVTTKYHPHGDYRPKNGKQIKQANLVAYVIENHNFFVYRGAVEGGEGYQMYLGDIGISQWFITVTLHQDGSATITHFGPFGISTAASIESKTSP